MLDILTITLNPAIDQTVYIDSFQVDKVNRIKSVQNDAGGKGVNVASYLSSSNLKVGATGFLGEKNSLVFEELFSGLNIENSFVYLSEDTRTNIKVVDLEENSVTDLNQAGFEISEENLLKLEEELFSSKKANWYVFSGSLPKGVSSDIYEKWIEKCKDLDIKVALDASGEALEKALKAKPNLIKPNNFELSELPSCKQLLEIDDIINCGKKLVGDGIDTVCISLGKDGSIIVNKDECFHALASNAEVKTTVGAGDALLSGLILGEIEELCLDKSIKRATAYSLSALKTVGPYLSSKKELEKLSNDVKVISISNK